MKKEKAITLIALIITIIVLLILAGVSISMLTGDNGILSKSKTAKENSNAGEIEEQNKLGSYNDMMDSYITSRGTTDSNFTWNIGTNYYAKKYDNGVMELYGKYAGTVTTNTIWGTGPVYYELSKILFPIQFVNTPFVNPVICRENSPSIFNVVLQNIDGTGFNCFLTSMSGQANNLPYSLSYIAIGNWK